MKYNDAKVLEYCVDYINHNFKSSFKIVWNYQGHLVTGNLLKKNAKRNFVYKEYWEKDNNNSKYILKSLDREHETGETKIKSYENKINKELKNTFEDHNYKEIQDNKLHLFELICSTIDDISTEFKQGTTDMYKNKVLFNAEFLDNCVKLPF